MELEEDLNLKILDEVKRAYLQTFHYLKNGKLNSSEMNFDKQEQGQASILEDRITFLYKFLVISPIPLLINKKTGGRRQVFQGEYLYGKNKIHFNIIGKDLEIELNMIQMFKKPQQCYVLHNIEMFQMNANRQNQRSKSSKNNEAVEHYYILDEFSQIFEDDSMDFISSLTRLSDSITSDDFVFETSYSSQINQMQKPLNLTHFKLLQPKVISSFEGIIIQVSEGKNLLQIEELIDQINLNSRRDRFYVLKVASGRNYIDTVEVYLIYDNEDQEAKQQLQFYLKPYQRILIFQSLKHFNANLKLHIISFFYSSGVQPNNPNIRKYSVSPKGLEFFSRFDIERNQQLCNQQVNNYNKLQLSNLSSLLQDEGVMIRSHMKLYVKVKKIKYFKIRLDCFSCKQEWTRGFKHCLNCKEQRYQVSFNIQVLVQDQNFLEQQAYIYLYDEIAVQFFNITEQERNAIQKHLLTNETFIQLYYSFNKDYSLPVIKFKDRIFTKDITKYIAAVPFADVSNKIFNSNQQVLQEEKQRIEKQNYLNDLLGGENDNNIFSQDSSKSINKNKIFINGTYIASNFAQGQRVNFKPIPCLRVVHTFPQEDIKKQASKILDEIQNLKIQLTSLY